VRLLLVVLLGLGIADFMLYGGLQTLVRHFPIVYETVWSPDRQFVFVIDRYAPLPFGLAGKGRSPGEVQIFHGRAFLDREDVEDVRTIRDVAWGQDSVTFVSDRDGRAYQGTLSYEQ